VAARPAVGGPPSASIGPTDTVAVPSRNGTSPVGVPPPGLLTVRVTGGPETTDPADDSRVTVLRAGAKVNVTGQLEAPAKSALLGKDITAVFVPASVGGPPSAAPEGVHPAQSVTDPFPTQG
jgi:hypothetical protein